MATANFRQNRQPNREFRQNRQVPLVPLASRRLAGSWPNPSRSSLRPQSPISGKNGNHISVALRVLRGYTSYSGRIGNRFPPAPNKKSEIPAESAMTVASPHGEGYPPRRRVLSRGGGTGPGCGSFRHS